MNAFGKVFDPLKTVAELVTADYGTNAEYYDGVIPTIRLLDKDVVKNSRGEPTDTLVLNLGQLPGFLDKLSKDCPNASVRNAASFNNSVFYKKTGWNKMFEKFTVRMTDKNPCY